MKLRRELPVAIFLSTLLACKSDEIATAAMNQQSSGQGGTSAAGSPAGVAGMDAGTALGQPPTAAASGASGVGSPGASGAGGIVADAGSAGQVADAHVCAIPDQIMILDEDADGGLDPTCQNVPRKVIANNCIGGICHDSNGPPASGLDLMAPCVSERMINVKSHCQDLLIIDTANPDQSLLFDKLNSAKAKCGETMPFTGHLPPDELACMNAWINAVIRAAK